ncbi:hypothetical protein GO730_26120 [Spirosoma sp. HMF3257]|uniref:Uncharacterized protein n=1 Tax=Spirosoma telluris TaxID=2183553 RepID=A0A327NN54_9BACT|nr:hypothetical protein [Spirosoma telluris]RAI76770.1 hypothetical protein HMF3257_26050 [Spirosoma telluris]
MKLGELDKLLISSILENEFRSDNSFLSYLTGSTPFGIFSKGDIMNLANPRSSVQALNATSDFSNLIHQIPGGNIYRIGGNLIWEEYNLLLNKVLLAEDRENGKKVSSEMPGDLQIKYSYYKEIREELFKAITDYSAGVLANKGDKVWQNTMSQRIEELQKKWMQEGYKDEIDTYIDKKIISNTLTFSSLWALWKGKFSEFLSINADLKKTGSGFATFYTPFNDILIDSKWQLVEFNHETVNAILPSIPFKDRKDDIAYYMRYTENVKFDFIKLNIDRSWLVSQIFEAKFWKMIPDFEYEIVSDGKCSGTIPAYIQEVIFVKNYSRQERKSLIQEGLEWFGEPFFKILYGKEETTSQNNEYYLMAMVCNIVPKCPNPDSNLKWP